MKSTIAKRVSFRPLLSIKADDSGVLPDRMEVLQTGMWEAPYHGDFMITPQDLQEYIQNFQANVRPSSSTEGLPIDLDHDAGEAAGWMTGLSALPNDQGGWSLWADVSWTPLGQEKLASSQYKFFSPEFCPEGYIDPEGEEDACDNVLIGGGLTNRPLFKDLQPITANDASGKSSGLKSQFKQMFLSAKETNMPTLDEVRIKEKADLKEDELQLLTEHKGELSADEQAKFGLAGEEEKPAAEKPAENTNVNTEVAPVTANDKGSVTISASELASLKEAAAQGVSAHEQLVHKAAEETINSMCFNEREGFKFQADLKDELVGLYVSANEAQKKTLDKLFEAATPIKSAADMGAKGSGSELTEGSAYVALQDKTTEIMKADDKIDYSSAMVQARRENPELAAAYDTEYNSGKPQLSGRE